MDSFLSAADFRFVLKNDRTQLPYERALQLSVEHKHSKFYIFLPILLCKFNHIVVIESLINSVTLSNCSCSNKTCCLLRKVQCTKNGGKEKQNRIKYYSANF